MSKNKLGKKSESTKGTVIRSTVVKSTVPIERFETGRRLPDDLKKLEKNTNSIDM